MSCASPAKVVCLVGPTGAGKTDVALELARRFPVEIISVDSAMVYRHMDIGTAKPSRDVLAEVPHRLIDIRDPWQSYSAGEFCADAHGHIRDILANAQVPLLVGGTLLYFRALERGLASLPAADVAIRRTLDERGEREGWAALHAELATVDAVAAARIDPSDKQRIQRALEVYQITGEPISQLQQVTSTRSTYQFLRIALLPGDRPQLYARIEARFAAMMKAGFLDEVRRLQAMPQMDAGKPAMRAVGYRQLWQSLEGKLDLAEAKRRAVAATRQYAKRQLTWLRGDADELRLDCLRPDVADQASRLIQDHAILGA